MSQDVFIVAAKRSPVCKAGGVLSTIRPDDLLAEVMKSTLKQINSIELENIDDVIIGCAMPEGAQGMNVARVSALLAQLPNSVPGMTVNRFCASGLEAIALGASRIQTGDANMIMVGGVESMSQVPMRGHQFSANPKFFIHDHLKSLAYSMGITAEKVAQKWNISRVEQDKFALASHKKALNALAEGVFNDEITPISVKFNEFNIDNHLPVSHQMIVDQDVGPRKDSSLELLDKLKPVFNKKGSVTAGNSSQRSDGAAVLILVSESYLKKYNLKPLARFMGYQTAGVAPEYMGIGPVAAVPLLLKKNALSQSQIQWIELNEAFAAQSLAVINELQLDVDLVNPYGGAIALGHPLGATGAIKATTLIHAMRRNKMKYGLVTLCVGMGMGVAGLFEAV